jgi:predicted GH43/DUF377 family glycosyl hydrolase
MDWIQDSDVFAPGAPGEPDSVRVWCPWVLEEPDGTLRMWYAGSDGQTSRILEAIQRPGSDWERLGIRVDAGLAGDSDAYGVEAPCVIHSPGGYLMVYGGFDSEVTRLHVATSSDGAAWQSQGTILQRGIEDAVGANHPCLVVTGERWWLFYTGYRSENERPRGAILAAISDNGASWDRLGPVLEPAPEEWAASNPCVLDIEREFEMMYTLEAGGNVAIALATSADGISWDRRGSVLPSAAGSGTALQVHTPCVVRLLDGSLRMWYAELQPGDRERRYRIRSGRFAGPSSR